MKIKRFTIQVGSRIFKALSNEARLRILHLLYHNQEMCTSDLELILGYTQTKVSRHLTYLKNSDLVNYRKQDQWTFYGIKEELSELTDLIFEYLQKDADLHQDLETYKVLYSNRELAINKLEQKERREGFSSF